MQSSKAMGGIYAWLIGPFVYVGKADVLERRRKQHIGLLRRGAHTNTGLQRAYNAYGDARFVVLEYGSRSIGPGNLLWLERKWIKLFLQMIGCDAVLNQDVCRRSIEKYL